MSAWRGRVHPREIDIGELLSAVVADAKASVLLLDRPRRREAAGVFIPSQFLTTTPKQRGNDFQFRKFLVSMVKRDSGAESEPVLSRCVRVAHVHYRLHPHWRFDRGYACGGDGSYPATLDRSGRRKRRVSSVYKLFLLIA